MQDEIAGILLAFMGNGEDEVYQLTPEEKADLDEADREIKHGEMVGEEKAVPFLRNTLMSVRFTAFSSRQIDEALSYIRQRSPSGAKMSRGEFPKQSTCLTINRGPDV